MSRKIILGLAVSLDGFIEGEKGEYDWCFTDQDYGMTAFLARIDTLLMGRKTYEMFQPTEDNPDAPPNPFPQYKQYVFSHTLLEAKGGAILLNGDLQTEVERLKENTGKDMWLFGGASLSKDFINHGLVDEIWLSIHPIILGAGKLLFQEIIGRIPLQLIEAKVYDTGLVSVRYAFGNTSEQSA